MSSSNTSDDAGDDPFPSDESEFSRSTSPSYAREETPEQLVAGPRSVGDLDANNADAKSAAKRPSTLTARHGKSKTSSLPVGNFSQQRKTKHYAHQQNGFLKPPSSKDHSLLEKASLTRGFKVNDLHNEIKLLKQKIKELESENKLQKRTQRRQSIALKRYEGNEADLPVLLRCHEEEVRSLRDQLRKTGEKYRTADRTLRERTVELERTRLQLQRLQAIVRDQCLGERNALGKKAAALEAELMNKDKLVQDLQRRLELTEKNYKHQLSIEFARHKETKSKMTELGKNVDALRMAVRERERELEIRNIYTSRQPNGNGGIARGAVATKLPHPSKKETKQDADNELNKLSENAIYEQDKLQTKRALVLNAKTERSDRMQKTNQNDLASNFSESSEKFVTRADCIEDLYDACLESRHVVDDEGNDDDENGNSTSSTRDASDASVRNTIFTMLQSSDALSLSRSNELPYLPHGASNREPPPFVLPHLDPFPASPVRSGQGRRTSVGDRNVVSLWSGFEDGGRSPMAALPPAFSNKTGKSNLMRQLFGSLEKPQSHHGRGDASADVSAKRDGTTYDAGMDKFVDLFNNNMSLPPPPQLVSKQGRERGTAFHKSVTKNIPGLYDEDGPSVLF